MITFSLSAVPLTRRDLVGDCSRCAALCCIALGFSRSADFAADKPAGTPCPQLAPDSSCTIHAVLPARGYRGCTVFDCFGAGQAVCERTFPDPAVRAQPGTRRRMFSTFTRTKQLHEMLWYLDEVQDRTYDREAAEHAYALAATITALVHRTADELSTVDVPTLHAQVRALLVDVSAEIRASYLAGYEEPDPVLHAGADLAGRSFRGRSLCGADLRGACLIGADLRGCDLTAVDLLGTDLRAARLDDADLSSALFVTGPQLAAARGNRQTRVPTAIPTPAWSR